MPTCISHSFLGINIVMAIGDLKQSWDFKPGSEESLCILWLCVGKALIDVTKLSLVVECS